MEIYTYTQMDAAFEPDWVLGATWMDSEKPHGSLFLGRDISEEPFDLSVVTEMGRHFVISGVIVPGGGTAGAMAIFAAESIQMVTAPNEVL